MIQFYFIILILLTLMIYNDSINIFKKFKFQSGLFLSLSLFLLEYPFPDWARSILYVYTGIALAFNLFSSQFITFLYFTFFTSFLFLTPKGLSINPYLFIVSIFGFKLFIHFIKKKFTKKIQPILNDYNQEKKFLLYSKKFNNSAYNNVLGFRFFYYIPIIFMLYIFILDMLSKNLFWGMLLIHLFGILIFWIDYNIPIIFQKNEYIINRIPFSIKLSNVAVYLSCILIIAYNGFYINNIKILLILNIASINFFGVFLLFKFISKSTLKEKQVPLFLFLFSIIGIIFVVICKSLMLELNTIPEIIQNNIISDLNLYIQILITILVAAMTQMISKDK